MLEIIIHYLTFHPSMRRQYSSIFWCLTIIILSAPIIIGSVSADPIDALDKAILNDLIEAYATHEPSTCNSAASISATSFSFDWPGTNSQSNWFAPLVSFEQGLFQAILSHNDSTGNRSWSIRIGSGEIFTATLYRICMARLFHRKVRNHRG